jgi:xylulokinase
MLAGLGAGLFRDVDDAIARCVHPDPAIQPDPAARAIYDDRYAAYRAFEAAAVVRRPAPTRTTRRRPQGG